ncbi:MAG: hypothetical protein U0768_21995 [Anaerolineae bacterium]
MPSKRPSLTDIAEEVARIAPADGDDMAAPKAAAEGAPKVKTRKRAASTTSRVSDSGLRESLDEKDRVIAAQEQTIAALRELVDSLRAQVDGLKREQETLKQEQEKVKEQLAAATAPPKKRRRRIPFWKPF